MNKEKGPEGPDSLSTTVIAERMNLITVRTILRPMFRRKILLSQLAQRSCSLNWLIVMTIVQLTWLQMQTFTLWCSMLRTLRKLWLIITYAT